MSSLDCETKTSSNTNPNAIYTNISEEEEEEIFEGDIRIRIMFGKKGKIWKLLGSGHYSYGEIIDGVQKTFVVESHPDITPTEKSLMDFENIDITVSSGLLKGEEDPVEVTDAIGSAVPLPWNSNSCILLYVIVHERNQKGQQNKEKKIRRRKQKEEKQNIYQ